MIDITSRLTAAYICSSDFKVEAMAKIIEWEHDDNNAMSCHIKRHSGKVHSEARTLSVSYCDSRYDKLGCHVIRVRV